MILIMALIVSSRFHISEQKVSQLGRDHYHGHETFCSNIQKATKNHDQAVMAVTSMIQSTYHGFSGSRVLSYFSPNLAHF